MGSSVSLGQRHYVVSALFGIASHVYLYQFAHGGGVPWTTVAGVGIVVAAFSGPVMWVARDRFPERRRSRLTLAGYGIALFLLLFISQVSIPFDHSFSQLSPRAVIIGIFVGYLPVLIAELTVVPERLRPYQEQG